MRVLIVDDSSFMRRALSRMLASDPGITVVGQAKDGKEGLDLALQLKPDVITLDIEMPEMDGLTTLRMIRARCPEPRPKVIMCSSLTHAGSHEALKALRLGAADVIGKEASDYVSVDRMRDELLAKVRALASGAPAPKHEPQLSSRRLEPLSSAPCEIIAIGSSTGGPPVLETVLTALPAGVDVPVIVAQHMPALFTKSLSERLNQVCKLRVVHAEEGRRALEPGHIYLIQGGKHGAVHRKAGRGFEVIVGDEPTSALYRPSVNLLLRSVGETAGAKGVGVVLTGMGEDGKEGGAVLHKSGGRIIAQSAATCVVYGMPRAVTEAGLASASLSPAEIGGWISAGWGASMSRAG